MTEQELQAIRDRTEAALREPWPVSVRSQFVIDARRDVPALLAELDAATQAIHDLQQESDAYWRGVQAERRRTLKLVLSHVQLWGRRSTEERLKVGPVRGLEWLREDLANPDTPPLPPDAIRAENARLRAALQKIADHGWEKGPSAIIAKNALEGKPLETEAT